MRGCAVLKGIATRLLEETGIKINGPNPWDITVHDERLYGRVLRYKSLGLGEAYMDSWWDCQQVDEFMCRILKSSIDRRFKGSLLLFLKAIPAIMFNMQSRDRAHIVAEHHYDLDNELFLSMLDPYIQYSCAYFKNTDDLKEAQINKLELICRKFNLCKDDYVLDIGSGWGGFARYAAERYGCSVVGVNVSKEQVAFAREFCRGLPVEFRLCDYRDITGAYDKIVSVGMFEHVGRKNYRTFMKKVHKLLKKDGIFLLHTIGNNISKRTSDPWLSKYIFPHGELPSIAQIARAAEGFFVIEDWHNLGPHYDRTLMSWHANFVDAWPRLKERYDERFRRMWEYYLLSCAGAFRARHIQVWQIVMTAQGTPQPVCRV